MVWVAEVKRSICPCVQRHDRCAGRGQVDQGCAGLSFEITKVTKLRNLAFGLTHEVSAFFLSHGAVFHLGIDDALEEVQLLIFNEGAVNLLAQSVFGNLAKGFCFFGCVSKIDGVGLPGWRELIELTCSSMIEDLLFSVLVNPLVARDEEFKLICLWHTGLGHCLLRLFGGWEGNVLQTVADIIVCTAVLAGVAGGRFNLVWLVDGEVLAAMLFDIEGVKASHLNGFLKVCALDGLPASGANFCGVVCTLTQFRQDLANVAWVLVVKRVLCSDVQGHYMRPGREHGHIFFLQILSCLGGGVAVSDAGNHFLAQSVFAVVLADERNGPLLAFCQLSLGQIFFRMIGNLQIAVCCKTICKLWIVRQEDWSATLSLASEVSGVLGKAVVHDLRFAVVVNNLAVTKPLFKCRRDGRAQAELLNLGHRNNLAATIFKLRLIGNKHGVAVSLWVVLNKEAASPFGGVLLAQIACFVAQANDHALTVWLLRIKKASIVVIAIPDAVLGASFLINQTLGKRRLGRESHRHVLAVVQTLAHGGPVVVVLSCLCLEEHLLAVDDLTKPCGAVGQVVVVRQRLIAELGVVVELDIGVALDDGAEHLRLEVGCNV